MREIFINSLLTHARQDKKVILVTGDLGFGVLEKFSQELPNQFINAGVSEQNMTGMSAGLALEGHNVFTYSIGNFPTLRCLEQIRNEFLVGKSTVYGTTSFYDFLRPENQGKKVYLCNCNP